ncbi:MAG TPA: CvpA family protein [Erysipelotrichaceae bacterium]|nr:CvpA family protein [Erysipelotrichaceae bacterium]
MISFPMNSVFIINLVVLSLIIISLLIGYFTGFIKQFFDLVILIISLFLAFVTSTSIASSVPFLNRNLDMFDDVIFGQFSYEISNIFIWFIIVVALVSIVLHQTVKPLIKQVKHLQWMNQVDKILGLFLALIPNMIWILLFMAIVLSPIFVNGKSTLEASVLKPLVPIAQFLSDTIIVKVDPYGLVVKVSSNEQLTEEDKNNIPIWLEEFGIPEDKVSIVKKFIQNEEFSSDDLSIIQEYIDKNNISEDYARSFLKRLGLSQNEIDNGIRSFIFE